MNLLPFQSRGHLFEIKLTPVIWTKNILNAVIVYVKLM